MTKNFCRIFKYIEAVDYLVIEMTETDKLDFIS